MDPPGSAVAADADRDGQQPSEVRHGHQPFAQARGRAAAEQAAAHPHAVTICATRPVGSPVVVDSANSRMRLMAESVSRSSSPADARGHGDYFDLGLTTMLDGLGR